jgi:RimJ/RimL family protein N-acetyltransferase
MLKAENTLLRMPLPEDMELLLSLRNDIELQSMLMSLAKPSNPSKIDGWIQKKLSDENSVFFIIADAKNNEIIGYLQFVNMDFIHQRGELGICIAKEHHGGGYAKEALLLLEGYVKNIFNIHKIVLQVLHNNFRDTRRSFLFK